VLQWNLNRRKVTRRARRDILVRSLKKRERRPKRMGRHGQLKPPARGRAENKGRKKVSDRPNVQYLKKTKRRGNPQIGLHIHQ